MATKGRNLFLYLALSCFVSLIAIFIVDGYLGIYDTVYVTAGEREQKIEPDSLMRKDWVWSTGVNRDEKVFFRYEIDNRQFSGYTADIEVSVWHGQEKVRDLTSQEISIAAFDKGEVGWVIDTAELVPADISPEQGYDFTVVIKRGEIERSLIIHVRSSPYIYQEPVAPPR